MNEETLLKIFSKNLRTIMNEENITQEVLANEIGLDRSMISRYINGQSLPSVITIMKIMDVLFCSFDDLTTE